MSQGTESRAAGAEKSNQEASWAGGKEGITSLERTRAQVPVTRPPYGILGCFMVHWGHLPGASNLHSSLLSISKSGWELLPIFPPDFTSLSANQMEWMPVACLPTTHAEWEVRRWAGGTLAPSESQLCRESWGTRHGGARINIGLSLWNPAPLGQSLLWWASREGWIFTLSDCSHQPAACSPSAGSYLFVHSFIHLPSSF